MKLASYILQGQPCIGLQLPSGALVDIAALARLIPPRQPVPTDLLALIQGGEPALASLHALSEAAVKVGDSLPRIDPSAVTWLPPVVTPSKIVCLALNNRALDAIKIRAPTDHPAFFLKPHTALTGHLQAIRLRAAYGLTHPEPELGVVIGTRLSNVTPEQALAGVFGYTIVNDITSVGMREEDSFSVRYFKPGPTPGEVTVGEGHTTYPGRYKASDTFAPMGPWLVTRDEIPDPADMRIQCRMGDRLVASDHTRNYVWDVPNALSHISRTMTLLPGDIVSMGTAVGGETDDPAAPQVPGVTRANLAGLQGLVSVSIERLGTLSNHVQMI
jgi:2-keto-4-pentenoate hydratase/2-oxohepta-3-ene-1,7-dioic acid hydratase in catechol pathway